MIKQSTGNQPLKKILWVTLLLLSGYWILETLIHMIFFSGNYSSRQLDPTTFLMRFLYAFMHPDPHEFYMRLLISIIILGYGAYLYRLIRQELSNQEHSALYDALTNIPNRKLLIDKIESTLKLSRRKSQPFALFHINPARMTPIRRLLSIVTKKSLLFFSFFQKKRSSQLSFDLVVVLFEYAPYFSCILVCSFI